MKQLLKYGFMLALAFSLGLSRAEGQSQGSNLNPASIGSSKSISLTVYNQDFGLVKDVREIDLKEGVNFIRFDDVAATIDPTSVSFSSLTAPNSVVVREQNYQYDLMDQNTILAKSVGKNVRFTQYLSSGAVHEIAGTLLSSPQVTVADPNGRIYTHEQSVVVKTEGGVIVGPSGELHLSELPEGLAPKPSLLWKLEAARGGVHSAEISYQAKGLNWKCDYVAVADSDDNKVDVTSWVTLDNQSGTSYRDATLKLMAGDVHTVKNSIQVEPSIIVERHYLFSNSQAPQFQEQSFAEYHLYSLNGKTNLANNETKQLSLFNASSVPVRKLYVYDGGERNRWDDRTPAKVQVKLELVNSKENNLGMPMPKGKVRVYKKDNDGALQFVGEDLIDHTPKDEKVRVYLGDAFDIVGEHKQTNVQRVSDRVQRVPYEISLRNHKKDAVTVTVVEHASGDWKITESNMPYVKKDSHTFEFAAKVAADSETKVTYEIETRW